MKQYQKPELQILTLCADDVLSASLNLVGGIYEYEFSVDGNSGMFDPEA